MWGQVGWRGGGGGWVGAGASSPARCRSVEVDHLRRFLARDPKACYELLCIGFIAVRALAPSGGDNTFPEMEKNYL